MIVLVNDTHANRLILDQAIAKISKLAGLPKDRIHRELESLQEE